MALHATYATLRNILVIYCGRIAIDEALETRDRPSRLPSSRESMICYIRPSRGNGMPVVAPLGVVHLAPGALLK